MRLLFVTQELGKIPSGVVTVLAQLCQRWPGGDRITVLMNPSHWAGEYLHHEFADRADLTLRRVPALLMNDGLNTALMGLPRRSRLALRIMLIPFTALQSVVLLLWLAAWMKANNIRGILSHNGGWPGGMLNRWTLYAGALANVPNRVLVIHNTPLVPGSRLRKLMNTMSSCLVGRAATRIVTVSNACRESLETQNPFGKPLDVVYNGIASAAPVGVVRSSPWEKEYPTIGFVGELHPRKGVHVLMEAFRRVDMPCELVLIGNGDEAYTDELRESAAGSRHPVHFLGFRDDVPTLYRWIDVLVLPSLNFESFGMVIVEAMRAGIPVICSDFGGMKEVVADGETGLIVRAGDAQSLASALTGLLEDADLRVRMGQAGKARMETLFESSVMTGHYTRFFHDQ
ncbi:MAG: glycosyltransferase family 4 protein [Betaproteobacteria bacterium]|nr:glycosyltransferase family 4 protein [Betaproteobacteria bacterium]